VSSASPNIELVYNNHYYYDPQVVHNNAVRFPAHANYNRSCNTSGLHTVSGAQKDNTADQEKQKIIKGCYN